MCVESEEDLVSRASGELQNREQMLRRRLRHSRLGSGSRDVIGIYENNRGPRIQTLKQ